jgi:hypothetical protein
MNNETQEQTEQTVAAEHWEFDTTAIQPPQLAGHAWRQRGVMVYCSSCPFEHGFVLDDPSLTLVGLDGDGYPQFIRHE